MKFLILPLLLLALAPAAFAQSFEISTTPRSQSVKIGQTARYTVKVTPRDGFDASVYFQAYMPRFDSWVPITPGMINAPYNKEVVVEFTPAPGDIGESQIIVTAYNGPVRVHDTVSVLVERAEDRPGWTRYTTSNSPLPNDTITAMTMDTDGSLWIGTMNGLAKFDGKNWEVFREMNNGDSILSGNIIWSLAVDSSNVIWVGTAFGISRRAANNWTVYRRGKGFPERSTPLNIISIASAPNLDVRAYSWRNEDTSRGEIWTFNGTDWTSSALPQYRWLHQIGFDSRGRFYTLSSDTLTRFDGTFLTTYLNPVNSLFGYSMELDRKGRLWTSSRGVVMRLEETGWGTRPFPSPVAADIMSIASDGDIGIWVTNGDAGVAHNSGSTWRFYDVSTIRQPFNNVRSVKVGKDGRVWAGTLGGGLLVLDPEEYPGETSTVPLTRGAAGTGTVLLAVTPNPTSGSLALHLSMNRHDHVRATLVNMMGEVVAELVDRNMEQGEHVVRVDAGDVVPGAYYVRLHHAGGIEISPVMVVR
jgi:hypothetical protein